MTKDEKQVTYVESRDSEFNLKTGEVIETHLGKHVLSDGHDVDAAAMQYAADIEGLEEVPPDIMRRLLWKSDLYITLPLSIVNGLAFADKTLSSAGSLLGLLEDLDMTTGDRFAWTTTIFYLLYVLASPFMIFLVKFPSALTLASCFTAWGVVVACTAAAQSYAGYMTCRALLGLCEAVVVPIQVLYISRFYPKHLQFGRSCMFFAFNGIGSILATCISYGLLYRTDHHTMSIMPWRVAYIIFGLLTFLFGISLFWLPETPNDAKFFSEEDKKWQVLLIKGNNSGGYGDHHTAKLKLNQVYQTLLDPRFYLTLIAVTFENIPNSIMSTFQSLIFKGLGFDPLQNLKMQLVSGATEMVGCILCGILASYFFTEHRIVYGLGAAALDILAMCLAAWSPTTGGKLAGFYLFPFLGPLTYVCFISYAQSNAAGHTRKLFMSGTVIAAYCIGNMCGAQAMKSSEAPKYPTGLTLMAASAVIACVCITLVFLLNLWTNHRRNIKNEILPEEIRDTAAFADLTDLENPEFRYSH